MARTIDELRLLQAMPIELKIRMTESRIRSFVNEYGEHGCYIAYSGGKDSTVLTSIVKRLYPKIPAAYCDTGLEYPEVRSMAISEADIVIKPKINFKEVIAKYGYPIISKEVSQNVYYARRGGKENIHFKKLFGTATDKNGKKSKYCTTKWEFLYDAPFAISHRCCDVLKKQPMSQEKNLKGRHAITGEMACEGMQRTTAWLRTGCNNFGRQAKCKPLSFWTDQDVLTYVLENAITIPSIYGRVVKKNGSCETTGVDRTGCIFCAFGAHLEKEPNRFQRLKITHPKLWDYCIKGGHVDDDGLWKPSRSGLGFGRVLDFIGIPFEQESLFEGVEG